MNDYLTTLNKDNCCGCRACESICPVNAITMQSDVQGFLYPIISTDKCINCNMCHSICKFANTDNENVTTVNSYAARHNNGDVIENSSSGGVFTALSDVVLKNSGVVFGHIFDDNFNLKCVATVSSDVRDKMRQSKYIQSDMKDVYPQIKKYLSEGRTVLFSGTPCQCAQVNSMYGNYENLITVDFVCHGTPSPGIFKDYINWLSTHFKDKLSFFNFRFKITNSSSQTVYAKFNKIIYVMPSGKDIFFKLFLNDVIFRHSCYNCKYTKLKRYSDITIGDYHSVKKVNPEFNTKNGVSMIIVNSEKGKTLLDKVNDLYFEKSDITKVLQPQLKHPAKRPTKYDIFWNEYYKNGFVSASQKLYDCMPLLEKIIQTEKLLNTLHIFTPLLKLIKNLK